MPLPRPRSWEILHELELPEDATEAAFERMVCHFLDLDSLQAVKASATALLEKAGLIGERAPEQGPWPLRAPGVFLEFRTLD